MLSFIYHSLLKQDDDGAGTLLAIDGGCYEQLHELQSTTHLNKPHKREDGCQFGALALGSGKPPCNGNPRK